MLLLCSCAGEKTSTDGAARDIEQGYTNLSELPAIGQIEDVLSIFALSSYDQFPRLCFSSARLNLRGAVLHSPLTSATILGSLKVYLSHASKTSFSRQ